MSIENKTALVTGASTGIGRSIAIELAKTGVFVYLTSRTKSRLKETKEIIEKSGGRAEVLTADLSVVVSINKLIKELRSRTKNIDIIVNVAGVWHGTDEVYADKDFGDFPQKVVLDTYMVGTIAPTLLVHGLLPLMTENSKIINISGTFENGAKGWLPYYVSKRAIEDLAIGLAEELKDKKIQVNCISPSDTATESYKKYFPQYIEESINPEEIAKFAIELLNSQNTTGKVFVMKKGENPLIKFHS